MIVASNKEHKEKHKKKQRGRKKRTQKRKTKHRETDCGGKNSTKWAYRSSPLMRLFTK
jgi:hypothetical protein